jgi:hypothetical protein
MVAAESYVEASQTRDFVSRKNAIHRTTRPSPLRLRSGQAFFAQRARSLWMTTLAGLLLGQVSDYGELECLTLVGFDDENDPDDEAAETDQRPHQ